MREVDVTGATKVLTACNSCRYNYQAGGAESNWLTPVESLVEHVAANLAD